MIQPNAWFPMVIGGALALLGIWILVGPMIHELRSKREGRSPRVRVQEDDEIVFGDFHMERLSESLIWFRLGNVAFELVARGNKLLWSTQEESWEEAARRLSHPSAKRT